MRKYFGTDGVRGIANIELTAELAFKIGKASAYVLKEHNHPLNTVLIARDTRISGEMLEAALVSSILSMGFNVLTCGIMPTPVLAWLTKKEKTVGFMVSASHNPWEHNGIKIFSNGFKLPDELEEEIESHFEDELRSFEVGRMVQKDMLSEYVEWLAKRYAHLKGYKISFDLANGAAVSTVPAVAEAIGLEVVLHNFEPDGKNINENCGALHPEYLSKKIKETDSDFGVIHDGDADRCIMITKSGRVVDGDDMLVINAENMKSNGRLKNNTVVGTVMTNLAIEEALKKNDINFVRTKVGDRYVLQEMKKRGATLGGEQSGHIIFFDLATTGDGLLTALETITAVSSLKEDLDAFVSKIKRYPQKMVNVKVRDKNVIMTDERISSFLRNENGDEEIRVVLRASGTEPLIRIMVEGKDEKKVNALLERARQLVEEVNSSGKFS
ncbi:phosphoglucosamine mutase [Mesoaciditoga sp.]